MSMPAPLAEVLSDFAEVQGQDKLTLLLEFANELPALPADLERVGDGGSTRMPIAAVFARRRA